MQIGLCLDDRRPYIGYVFTFINATLSWEARKQWTVALSSTKAKYMAMLDVTKEAIYLENFLEEFRISWKPVLIYNDNQGAVYLVKNWSYHSHIKYVDTSFCLRCIRIKKEQACIYVNERHGSRYIH